jgi:23S rRNA pseudouridine1911/1915/1917 synthase
VAGEHISVAEADAGKRLDQVLRRWLPGLSRAAAAEAVATGLVRVNGRRASKGQLLCAGDVLEVSLEAQSRGQGPAADPELALHVLYEDPWLVLVDKAAGVPSAALRAGEKGTVASALLARYPQMAQVGYRPLEPGLLHRLDTDTSGVLLAARDAQTFATLRLAHERGEIDKTYLALCAGAVRAPQQVQGFLRADQRRVRVEAHSFERSRPIHTELLSARTLGSWSLVQVRVTFAGRHQVRAQLAALGHPIAADALYDGPPIAGLERHFLHASELRLLHPHTQQPLSVKAELPAELRAVLDGLGEAGHALLQEL